MKNFQGKIVHTFMLLALLIIVAAWIITMVWWLYPYKTSEQTQPYEVINTTVTQGEILYYKMHYCKYTDAIPKVERQFIDGLIYAVPQGNAQIKKGCGDIVNSIVVPTTLPAGTYYVHATVIYQMNPIRTIIDEYKTEKFTVLKKT